MDKPTIGKWYTSQHERPNDYSIHGENGFVCWTHNGDKKYKGNPDSLSNARIIVTAVNACKEINPDNPQEVAESIGEMYQWIKELAFALEEGYEIIGASRGMRLSDILSKIDGK